MTRGTFDSSWWNRVWLVAALSLAAWPAAGLTAPATAGDREFADLFNGHDLEGWVVESHADSEEHPDGRPVWSVRDGEIVCDGQGFGFLRYAAEPFADVTLRLDFQLQKPAGRRSCNSGIGLRTVAFDERRSQATRPSIRGYELQLLDDAAAPPTTHSCGAIYRYVAPREHALRPTGEWNTLEVAMIGPRIRVTLNERLIHDVDQFEVPAIRSKPLSGFIALQNHGGPARFRNIRVRREQGRFRGPMNWRRRRRLSAREIPRSASAACFGLPSRRRGGAGMPRRWRRRSRWRGRCRWSNPPMLIAATSAGGLATRA